MKKFWPKFFVMGALGCLLAMGSWPAQAYYPPLQATATSNTYGVKYTVYNPKLQKTLEEGSYYWENSFVELKQHQGVIAWVLYYPVYGHYVFYCVYDPALAKFMETVEGPFTQVSQLTVKDGVVAYVATAAGPGAVPAFVYATYDPIKRDWQKRTWPQMDGFTNLQVSTQDGVVLRWQEIVFISGVALEADIYDAALGKWTSHIVYADQAPYVLQSFGVANATVVITRFTGVEWVTENHGYDHSLGDWYSGVTKPMAFFAFHPGGQRWAWFTDLSIGGSTWNWNLGDGYSSGNRSPYHVYPHNGTYSVTQNINSGASTYTRTISVGSGSNAIYMLLLKN